MCELPRVLAGLCLSVNTLLACEPYTQCDESLEVGDELHFKLTADRSVQGQIDECGGELPFGVGSEFHLQVEKFVEGDRCDSATGDVVLSDVAKFQWYSDFDRSGGPNFRGDYLFKEDEGCESYLELNFYDDGLQYLVSGGPSDPCPVTCTGLYDGVWVE